MKKGLIALYMMFFLFLNTGFFNLGFFKSASPAPTPLKIFRTLPDGSFPDPYGHNSSVSFVTANPESDSPTRYITNGTSAGTMSQFAWNPVLPTDAEFLAEFAGLSYFFSDFNQSVWRTDGTILGTMAVTANGDVRIAPTLRLIDGGGANYVYWDGYDPSDFSYKMYVTTGTLASTHIEDFPTGVTYSDAIGNASGLVIVVATTGIDEEMYVFNPFTHSFSGALAVFPGMDGGRGDSYSDEDTFFFPLHKGGVGNYMYATNGSIAGTYQLETIVMMDSTLKHVTTTADGSEIFLGQPSSGGGGTYRFYKTNGTSTSDWTQIADTGLHLSTKYWIVDSINQLPGKAVVRFYGYNDASNAASCPMWVTDGTAGGTSLLASVAVHSPADAGATSSWVKPIVFGSSLYFQGYDATAGVELWKYDGSSAPARLVDLDSAATSSIREFDWWVTPVSGGSFFVFPAYSPTDGFELFRSDGTAAGTFELRDINPGINDGLILDRVDAVNGKVVFQAKSPANGVELWATDGTTAGTTLIGAFNQLPGDSNLSSIQVIGSKMYFQARDDSNGTEPWVSDGTNSGTVLLKNLVSGDGSSSPVGFTSTTNGVVFSVESAGSTDYQELWVTDGTTGGTSLLATDRIVAMNLAVSVSGAAYFVAADVSGDQELWKSDGSVAGTARVKNISATNSAFDWGIDWMQVFGNYVLFAPNRATFTFYDNPWVTDGTSAGTQLLMNINMDAFAGSYPSSGISIGSLFLFFARNSDPNYLDLFRTDGTPAGTAEVKQMNAVDGNSNMQMLGAVGGRAILSSNDGVYGQELWASDGTELGTIMIKDISPGAASSLFSGRGADDGSFVYFLVKPDGGSWQLWKTDGTSGGTSVIFTGASSDSVNLLDDMVSAGGYLFYQYCTAANGCELWRSDKTGAGTRLFWDLNPGAGSSYPYSLRVLSGSLYFFADYNSSGALWKTGYNSH